MFYKLTLGQKQFKKVRWHEAQRRYHSNVNWLKVDRVRRVDQQPVRVRAWRMGSYTITCPIMDRIALG